eukprot:9408742-Heterocapsa_arctica.AAC.1
MLPRSPRGARHVLQLSPGLWARLTTHVTTKEGPTGAFASRRALRSIMIRAARPIACSGS